MKHANLFAMGAAVAITAGGLVLMAPSAQGRTHPLVVTAPLERLPVERVSYADLNLASARGKALLERRVGSAVREVCLGASNHRAATYAESSCRTAAWADARPQMELAYERAGDIARTGNSAVIAATIRVSAHR